MTGGATGTMAGAAVAGEVEAVGALVTEGAGCSTAGVVGLVASTRVPFVPSLPTFVVFGDVPSSGDAGSVTPESALSVGFAVVSVG